MGCGGNYGQGRNGVAKQHLLNFLPGKQNDSLYDFLKRFGGHQTLVLSRHLLGGCTVPYGTGTDEVTRVTKHDQTRDCTVVIIEGR